MPFSSRRLTRLGAGVVISLSTIAVWSAGCTSHSPNRIEDLDAARTRPDRVVTLHDHPLVVHLVSTTDHPHGPLLLYATGDGGWTSDESLFDRMRPWGYAMAGFSAADYVGHLGSASTIAPPRLADDYVTIVTAALDALGMPPNTRVVLVGLSRGSGLDVAAATDARLQLHLAGLLVVALTGEEEYVDEPPPDNPQGRSVMFQTYEALPRLGRTRVAVIQSTRDQYLPADTARLRFGPDTAVRHFQAIDAAGHTFGGKLPELYAQMKRDLEWITGDR